jgi:hypothetical protein
VFQLGMPSLREPDGCSLHLAASRGSDNVGGTQPRNQSGRRFVNHIVHGAFPACHPEAFERAQNVVESAVKPEAYHGTWM